MKKTLLHTALLVLVLALGLLLMRCERTPFETVNSDNEILSTRDGEVCEPWVIDLWAGAGKNDTTKAINVGYVTVTDDSVYLYVTYNITKPNTYLDEVHLWVGSDYMTIPKNAAPGQFPYKEEYMNGDTTYYEFAPIYLADLSVTCEDTLYIAAHAEIHYKAMEDGMMAIKRDHGYNDNDMMSESAWAWGENTFIEHNIAKKWGWFFKYITCCPQPSTLPSPEPQPGPKAISF